MFLVGITGDPDRRHVTSIAELNRLFTAWTETVYHRRVHSETGQAPLVRWAQGWAGTVPALPGLSQLHEAFLWSERHTVRKTATVSLHGNTYQAGLSLTSRRVELIFDPFDLASIEVRWQGNPAGQAVPHVIGRHSHPKARAGQPAPPARPRPLASTTSSWSTSPMTPDSPATPSASAASATRPPGSRSAARPDDHRRGTVPRRQEEEL